MDVDNSRSLNLLTKAGTDSVDMVGGGAAHSTDGGANDPFTDWIYWVLPNDISPGEAGYEAVLAGTRADIAAGKDPYLNPSYTNGDVMGSMVIVGWNMGNVATGPGSYSMTMPEVGTTFRIETTKPHTTLDVFTITVPPADQSLQVQRADVERVNVFPNPFVGGRDLRSGKSDRFVTFTHLPQRAIIRIYTLSGKLVRSFLKEDVSQFLHWDLNNEYGQVVAGGIYVAHIEMPDVGMVKILKLGVVASK